MDELKISEYWDDLEKLFLNTILHNRNSSDLVLIALIGFEVRELHEKYEISPSQIVNDLKILKSQFIQKSIDCGCHLDEEEWEIPNHLKNQNRKNKEKFEKKSTPSSTMSLGEFIKRTGGVKKE